MEQLLDVLKTILPTEIYQPIIIYGVICFYLFFYGAEQWGKYSDFDKVVFSLMLGVFIYYLFILPFTFFLITFQKILEIGIINYNDLILLSNSLFFILVLALFIYRIIYNKPLNNNKDFLKETKYYIVLLLIAVTLMQYALFCAFYFSTYKEYSLVMLYSIILFLFAFVILYIVFINLFQKKLELAFYSDKRFDIDLKKFYKTLILLIIVITIGASLGGMYFFNTTNELTDQKNTGLEISKIETWNRSNLSGIFDVEQHYTIKFSYIPWIKIKPNISLIDSYGKPYYTRPNYIFRGEYEVIINDSKWSTINVSLNGKKRDNNLPRIYKIEKKDFNETVQRWDMIFTNPYDMYIKIYEVDIEKDKQFNQLINYNITNMDFDKEALDETLINKQNKETITIKDVGVRHKSRNLNQSITLFFATTPIY